MARAPDHHHGRAFFFCDVDQNFGDVAIFERCLNLKPLVGELFDERSQHGFFRADQLFPTALCALFDLLFGKERVWRPFQYVSNHKRPTRRFGLRNCKGQSAVLNQTHQPP